MVNLKTVECEQREGERSEIKTFLGNFLTDTNLRSRGRIIDVLEPVNKLGKKNGV